MNSKTVIFFCLALIFAFTANAAPAPAANTTSDDVVALGEQFQALRQVEGFFDGAEWTDEVDNYDGKKYEVMNTLLDSFLSTEKKTTKEEIVRVMGEPDLKQLPEGVELNAAIPRIAGKFWVYKWRGEHDFVWAFMAIDEYIMVKGWYHKVADVQSAEVIAMREQFRALRKIKGHFDGGDFNADVDNFNGAKHQVMKQLLGTFLSNAQQPTSAKDLITIMGKPDARKLPKGVKINAAIPKIAGNFWVYKWRGMHDFVWTYMANDKTVVAKGWYFALE